MMASFSSIIPVLILVLFHLVCFAENRVFTPNSVDVFNKGLRNGPAQKMVFVDVSQEGNKQYGQRVYLVIWPSLLYLKPYTRFYSFHSITKDFSFANLIVEANCDIENQNKSFLISSIANETDVRSQYPSFLICALFSNFESSYIYEKQFLCLNTTSSKEIEVTPPAWLITEDMLFLFLHLFVIGGLLYHINLKMYHVRRAHRHICVEDSIYNPPFWQYSIPYISTKLRVNFKIWESLYLISAHVIMYVLVMLTLFTPSDWSAENGNHSRDIKQFTKYIFLSLPIITINIVSMVLKLYNNARTGNLLRIEKSMISLKMRIVHGLWALCIGAVCSSIITTIILKLDDEQHGRAKQILYGIFGSLYGPTLALYLIMKPVYISQSIVRTITRVEGRFSSLFFYKETEDDTNKEISESKVADKEILTNRRENYEYYAKNSMILIIFSDIWNSLYYTSFLWIAFVNGHVVVRFIWSSISNIMVNPDMISTYR
jgi:hypothetical protein